MTPSKLLKRLRIDDPDGFRLASSNRCARRSRPKGARPRMQPNKRRSPRDDDETPRISYRHLGLQPFRPTRRNMSSVARFSAALIVATVAAQTAVLAQGLEVRRYNPSEWTKGRFSEVVTVNRPTWPSAGARRMATGRSQPTPF